MNVMWRTILYCFWTQPMSSWVPWSLVLSVDVFVDNLYTLFIVNGSFRVKHPVWGFGKCFLHGRWPWPCCAWLGAGKRGRRNSVGSLDSTIEVSRTDLLTARNHVEMEWSCVAAFSSAWVLYTVFNKNGFAWMSDFCLVKCSMFYSVLCKNGNLCLLCMQHV